MKSKMADDSIVFAAESESSTAQLHDVWRILIVDDEEQVHVVTRLVLQGFTFEGKGIEMISAFSAAEARKALAETEHIALVLLDVVMERDDAGLQLVHYIRETLGNKMIRIILRTGQPGAAPEANVIVDYDINDYREKTELTAQKLLTTVISALRSYRDLSIIEMNKNGLEKIIEASPEIFRMQSMQNFAAGILMQLSSMLKLSEKSLYLKISSFAATCRKDGDLNILAATGEFSAATDSALPLEVKNKIDYVLGIHRSMFFDGYFILYWQSKGDYSYLIYMEGTPPISDLDRRLLDIFCLNISAAFENLKLHLDMYDTQREVFFRLAEVAETRSQETGNHVRRVAEYVSLLGKHYGLSEKEVDMMHLAAPMHDIGKLGIPDGILNKPGKLTETEFQVIKRHSLIGHDMLHGSELEMLNVAAVIAAQHHERYDGTGYPAGLQGEDIHIYARITAIADVFDALGSDRVYKKAWPLPEIIAYFEQQRGKQFDPGLTDLFLSHMDQMLAIREEFLDIVLVPGEEKKLR